MTNGHQRRAAAFVLAEVLTAAVVFSIVFGCVVSIYIASLRTWGRGASENYAQQKASWSVQRMAPDLRLGMSVTPGNAPFESSYIAVHLPNRVFDSTQHTHFNQILTTVDEHGETIPYLVPGGYAVYYRGDAEGNMATDGDRIWRKLLASNGETVMRSDVIADHVVDNPVDSTTGSPTPLFVYWPDIYRLNSVQITVTVQEKQGGRTSTATMNSEFALRNR